ncbi:MAG: hypothetical protein ABF899_04275 [Oenococcus sp.]|uniref:hypothetical protein n=1 Tax=Oenococcus sp. TaxID=1979414 RepID=UPI0039EA6353
MKRKNDWASSTASEVGYDRNQTDAKNGMAPIYTRLYSFVLIIWLTVNMFRFLTLLNPYLENSAVSRFLFFIVFILFGFSLFFDQYPNIVGLISVVFSLVIFYRNHSLVFLETMLLIYASRNQNTNNILRIFLFASLFVISVTLALNRIGLLTNRIFFQDGRVRNSYGFLYTTLLPQLSFFLVLSYLYLRRKKMILLEFFILLSVVVLIYMRTSTRDPFILSVLAIFLAFAMRSSRVFVRIFTKCSITLIPIFLLALITSFVLAQNYQNLQNANQLNDLFSGRLGLAHNALMTYGNTFFGQQIEFIGSAQATFGVVPFGESYNYVDSSYLQNYLLNGIAGISIIVLLYTWKMLNLFRNRNLYLLLFYALIAVHSFSDPQLFLPWYSPFVLLLGEAFETPDNSNRMKYFVINAPNQKY